MEQNVECPLSGGGASCRCEEQSQRRPVEVSSREGLAVTVLSGAFLLAHSCQIPLHLHRAAAELGNSNQMCSKRKALLERSAHLFNSLGSKAQD